MATATAWRTTCSWCPRRAPPCRRWATPVGPVAPTWGLRHHWALRACGRSTTRWWTPRILRAWAPLPTRRSMSLAPATSIAAALPRSARAATCPWACGTSWLSMAAPSSCGRWRSPGPTAAGSLSTPWTPAPTLWRPLVLAAKPWPCARPSPTASTLSWSTVAQIPTSPISRPSIPPKRARS